MHRRPVRRSMLHICDNIFHLHAYRTQSCPLLLSLPACHLLMAAGQSSGVAILSSNRRKSDLLARARLCKGLISHRQETSAPPGHTPARAPGKALALDGNPQCPSAAADAAFPDPGDRSSRCRESHLLPLVRDLPQPLHSKHALLTSVVLKPESLGARRYGIKSSKLFKSVKEFRQHQSGPQIR